MVRIPLFALCSVLVPSTTAVLEPETPEMAPCKIGLEQLVELKKDGVRVFEKPHQAFSAHKRCRDAGAARGAGGEWCSGSAAHQLDRELFKIYGVAICSPVRDENTAAQTSGHTTAIERVDVVTERDRLPKLFEAVFVRLRGAVESLIRSLLLEEERGSVEEWMFLDNLVQQTPMLGRKARGRCRALSVGRGVPRTICQREEAHLPMSGLCPDASTFPGLRCQVGHLADTVYATSFERNARKLASVLFTKAGGAFSETGMEKLLTPPFPDDMWVESVSDLRQTLSTDEQDLKRFKEASIQFLQESKRNSVFPVAPAPPHETASAMTEFSGNLTDIDELMAVKELNVMVDSLPSTQRHKMRELLQLPQVVVVGPQSHGKSTTLEMLAGLNFLPRGMDIVTTRPFRISIHHDNSMEDPFAVVTSGRGMVVQNFDGPDYAVKLKAYLEDLNPKGTISKEAVDVVLYNPGTGVNLTLVDLPGHTFVPGLKNTTEELFDEYCAANSTVILLVHDCQFGLETSPVQQIIKEKYDPTFSRTFGVMTKMNLQPCFETTSDDHQDRALKALGVLANDKESPFSFPTYGWVGITGQGPRQLKRLETVQQTREKEKDFFDNDFMHQLADTTIMTKLAHATPNHDEGNYGVGTDVLRERLGKALKNNIKARLPKISGVIDEQLRMTQMNLTRLGKPPPKDEAGRFEYIKRKIVQPWQHAIRSQLESDLHIRLQAIFDQTFRENHETLLPEISDAGRIFGYPSGCKGNYDKSESTKGCRESLLDEKLPEIYDLAGHVFTVGRNAFHKAAFDTEANLGRNSSCQVPEEVALA